jgi:hypothetical protein
MSAAQDSSGHTLSWSTTSSPRTAATETGQEDVAAKTRTTAVRSFNCRVGYRFGFDGRHLHEVGYATRGGLGRVFIWELGQDKRVPGQAKGCLLLEAAAAAAASSAVDCYARYVLVN